MHKPVSVLLQLASAEVKVQHQAFGLTLHQMTTCNVKGGVGADKPTEIPNPTMQLLQLEQFCFFELILIGMKPAAALAQCQRSHQCLLSGVTASSVNKL